LKLFGPVTIASTDGEKQAACEGIDLNCAVQQLRITKVFVRYISYLEFIANTIVHFISRNLKLASVFF
jgi:hypothetical protein